MFEEVKTFREGALFAVSIAVLGMVGIILPPLYLLVSPTLPVLPAIQVWRHGLWAALGSLAVSCALMSLVFRPIVPFYLLLQLGIPGILLGLIFKNRLSLLQGTLVSLAGMFLCAALASLSYLAITGQNPFSPAQFQNAASQLMASYGNQQGSQALVQVLKSIVHLLLLLWPGIIFVWTAGSILLAYVITRLVFLRQEKPVPRMAPFTAWHLPWYSIWLLIPALGLALSGQQFNWPLVSRVGDNLLYVACVMYLVAGASLGALYYNRLGGHRTIRLILLISAFFYPQVVILGLIMLGVIDAMADLRKVKGQTGE